jgi:hypothetical protein
MHDVALSRQASQLQMEKASPHKVQAKGKQNKKHWLDVALAGEIISFFNTLLNPCEFD